MEMEMESNAEISIAKFGSFAVLDLEIRSLSDFGNNYHQAVKELCIYGFSPKSMCEDSKMSANDQIGNNKVPLPEQPSELHKLTLFCYPDDRPGLLIYDWSIASKFDTNTCNTVLGFLRHLEQPVCLVAHYGWGFDFPILKQIFRVLQKDFPEGMTCVDSLRAFMEIDDVRDFLRSGFASNESPHSLSFGEGASPLRKKYPPKGVYPLSNMFKRIFNQPAEGAHQAEPDVDMLMCLMLHYGKDFVDYANQHARPITDVPPFGTYN